jgi:hypothetical protein
MLALQTQIGKAVVTRISILVINILAFDGSFTFGLRHCATSLIPGRPVLKLVVLGVVPVVLLLVVARVSRHYGFRGLSGLAIGNGLGLLRGSLETVNFGIRMTLFGPNATGCRRLYAITSMSRPSSCEAARTWSSSRMYSAWLAGRRPLDFVDRRCGDRPPA